MGSFQDGHVKYTGIHLPCQSHVLFFCDPLGGLKKWEKFHGVEGKKKKKNSCSAWTSLSQWVNDALQLRLFLPRRHRKWHLLRVPMRNSPNSAQSCVFFHQRVAKKHFAKLVNGTRLCSFFSLLLLLLLLLAMRILCTSLNGLQFVPPVSAIEDGECSGFHFNCTLKWLTSPSAWCFLLITELSPAVSLLE